MKHIAINTKKILAASGLAFGLVGFGLFAGVGTAVADGTMPNTGSYDELTRIPDEDATQGDFDDDGIQADDVLSSAAYAPEGVT